MDFLSSNIMAIQVKGEWGILTLINIYNNGNNNKTINKLSQFQQTHSSVTQDEGEARTHTIGLGDFNRHHPHLDDLSDTRLFTPEATRAAEALIETLAENDLVMALPSRLPTHCHNVTKHWTRLDQVFISKHSENLVVSCNTLTEHRGVNTDHLPILMELDMRLPTLGEETLANFHEVDWEAFGKDLERCLSRLTNTSGDDCNAKTTRSVL